MKQKITIIGWTDWFWKWLAGFMLKNFKNNIELTIIWRNEEKLKKVSLEIGSNYSLDNKKVVSESDITIFAVPIAYTEEIIEKYAPFLKINSMVLDVTSIKIWPSNALKKFSPKSVLVLPTHPMFWPHISTIRGQIFVLCPLKEEDKLDFRYKFLKKTLTEMWAKVVEENPIEHDRMMAIVQWVTHFNMFVIAWTIRKLNFDIDKSFNFISPIYKIMMSSVWRYIWQNPKLYWDIQMYNTEVLKVHNVFIDVASDFNKYIEQKDEESFIENIKDSAKYFWKNTEKGQKYTDKIIFMIWRQLELAEKSVWKEIRVENIYSREIKIWILNKFNDKDLFLNSWEILDLDEWEII